MKFSLESPITLGKYAIKMGLAATLAAVIAERLHLQYPIYALIAPIIIMGTTRGSTWTAGINRMKGTVIGTVAGATFNSVLGSNPLSLLTGSTLVIFLCRYLELGEAYRLAGYVTTIVILEHSDQPWLYAWGRFLETTIGIFMALLVNTYLWPSPATENLRKTLTQMLTDLDNLYQIIFKCYITGEYQEETINSLKVKIIKSIRESEPLWQEAKKEQSGEPWVDETWEFLVRRLWEHVSTMNHAALDRQEDTFWQGVGSHLTELAQMTSMSFAKLNEAVAAKHRYLVLPDLDRTLYEANERLEHLQKVASRSHSYPVAELLRFASFFYSMEEIARKLKKMGERFQRK